MDISSRHAHFQNKMKEEEVGVAFLVKPHNVFYFAGHAPVCAGVLLFSTGEPVFSTIWLDAPEAKETCQIRDIAGYVFPRESLTGKMIQLISKRHPNPKRIGVEKDFLLLRDYDLLSEAFPGAEFVHVTPVIDRLRAIKSEEEIACIEKAADISDKAMEAAIKAVRPGVTELDVAAEAEYVMKKSGSERPAFSTFVASGKRTLLAHPIASRKEIEPQDPVVIDLGASWEGYAADVCRTTFAGEPSSRQTEFLRSVIGAQQAASSVIRDGAKCRDAYDAAYTVFEKNNLAKHLPDDIGYGVGLRQSEFYPIIEKDSETVLMENMVVALLQTTSYSKKIGGLRVEDTFRITGEGCKKLTKHPQPTFD
jgi:Xaa-Pro aminopeptidase